LGDIALPSDMLDHATGEIALPREIKHWGEPVQMPQDYLTGRGSKLGIAATKKLPGEGFKRPWPPLIKMDAAVKAKVEKLFNK
jgi:3-polyprenyl-4-hydroxybenzoate decarboxylase